MKKAFIYIEYVSKKSECLCLEAGFPQTIEKDSIN